MKQVVQSLADGTISLADVPVSHPPRGSLLIQTSLSLVSAGTERMLVDFGKANLLDKARSNPDKLHQAIDKARSDGIIPTIQSIRSKLEQPHPLGYCNVGTVVGVGDGVTGFSPGDRVVSNGPHAETVVVPQLLCAPIPPEVSDEAASFTVLASIGLQGIRLASPTFGESFLVSGLGLIGLLTAQLLQSHGCRVYGLDPDPDKCQLANSLGVKSFVLGSSSDALEWILSSNAGARLDGVLITASTSSSDPVHLAAEACRQRGRIVLVGVTGLELRRDLFYKKELTFQVSCSYGPGRYDPSYELLGNDYPVGFVRWTQQRNFHAVLQALAIGSLLTSDLITHRYPLAEAAQAYSLLSSPQPSLGIILDYPNSVDLSLRTLTLPKTKARELSLTQSSDPFVSVIGSGNYATRVLIPAFRKAGIRFHTLASSNGLSPSFSGPRHGFSQISTDVPGTIDDPLAHAVVIATRHDSHAALVQHALSAGKHVFVEKPLCLTEYELDSVEATVARSSGLLMVGFNRRFAPLLIELRQALSRLQGPRTFVYTVNAGPIPSSHWIQDPVIGGGRLLGEACHFVDLLRHLAGSPIEQLELFSASDSKPCPDTFTLSLRFVDGSIGTVHYFSNGTKSFPKERLEVFASGRVLRLDNYRKLEAWGIPGFRTRRRLSQDKGQLQCCKAFLTAIRSGGPEPIALAEVFEVQRWLLHSVHS